MLQAFFLPVANSGEGEHVLHLLHGTAGRPALFTTFSVSSLTTNDAAMPSTTPEQLRMGEVVVQSTSTALSLPPCPDDDFLGLFFPFSQHSVLADTGVDLLPLRRP